MKHLASICQLSPTQLRQVDGFLPGPEPTIRGARRIPVCEPVIGDKEKKYVASAMSFIISVIR